MGDSVNPAREHSVNRSYRQVRGDIRMLAEHLAEALDKRQP